MITVLIKYAFYLWGTEIPMSGHYSAVTCLTDNPINIPILGRIVLDMAQFIWLSPDQSEVDSASSSIGF